MSQNVMIPLSLLDKVIELLDHWDISEYGPSLRYDYENVFWALKVKKQKLELRDAYAKIIRADNEDDRDDARMQYLLQKRFLREDNVEEEPF